MPERPDLTAFAQAILGDEVSIPWPVARFLQAADEGSLPNMVIAPRSGKRAYLDAFGDLARAEGRHVISVDPVDVRRPVAAAPGARL